MRSKAELMATPDGVDPARVLVGEWTNELKSTMSIERVADGVFTGVYVSEVSETHQTVQGRLSGVIADDAIAFTVNWGDPVTAWTGRLLTDADGGYHLYTLWNLAQHSAAGDWWESIKAGSDLFHKVA